uniref:Uncharacterized protein n=1 Tax=Dactylella sp. TaxID=1814903 RepID=A0A482DST6_9PEZI|nr:hypothetical protein [Dactylella sp.]
MKNVITMKSIINNRMIFNSFLIRIIRWLREKKNSFKLYEKKENKNLFEFSEKKENKNLFEFSEKKGNMKIETINNIKEILSYKIEKLKGLLNNFINISKLKFVLFINKQISEASLLVSFNYLIKYNFKNTYLENLNLLTQIGRDRLYPGKWLWKSLLWDKLSKFGNLLKILVLKHNLKIMDGWVNHSSIVTNQNISLPLAVKLETLNLSQNY